MKMSLWNWLKSLPGPQIKVEPPGPKSREIIKKGEKVLATSTREEFYPAIAKMEGDIIWDVDGNIYIDFFAGVAVLNVGSRNPEVVQAIQTQLNKFIHDAPQDFYDEIQVIAAEKLASVAPGNFSKKVFFANSGAESVECAMKVAQLARKAHWFIAFVPSFHGRTLGSLALTASKKVHRKGYLVYPYVEHVPYSYCYRCPYKLTPDVCDIWCAKIIEEILFEHYIDPNDVAAIFVEPITGEGGYVVPHPKFIATLRKICDKHGILLVSDEVQMGFGRTGKWWGIQNFDVVPDVMTCAKSIAAGVPLGACVFNAKYDFPYPGAHSSTYGGNALALAAMVKVIEIIEREKLYERARKLGEQGLKKLKDELEDNPIVGDIRGLGLAQGIEIVKDKKTKAFAPDLRDEIIKRCVKKGLLLLPCGKSTIRIAPPLIIREEMYEKGLDIIIDSIKEVSK